ncbi:sulfur carrier protein ThiS [Sessilibacter sp. MAH2]
MTRIILNGEPKEFADVNNLDELLNAITDLPQNFATAVNMTFVPKCNYSSTVLHDGDEIELLVPMQGG